MFNERFTKKLKQQKKTGLYRNPPKISKREGKYLYIGNKKMVNFASNDYLGFGSMDYVKKIIAQNFEKYGSSSSSSRLVTGNFNTMREAEKTYADYFGYDDAVFFPSGYQANLGLLSTLFDNDDTIIFDKHIHASSVKGISLSGAEFTGYKHNSMSHLEKKLINSKDKNKAVVTEALFSMDGDYTDFKAIKSLKSKYNFTCIADEAHSYGAVGDKGKGLSSGVADIGVGTFGKAFGLFGAFILLPKLYREYLVNFASPYIYTTSLPEAHAATTIDILRLIEKAEDKREHLHNISKYAKTTLGAKGFKVAGDAHILAIEIGDEEKTVKITKELQKRNIFTFPARFPTVPLDKAIIRISLTSMHSKEDILHLCAELSDCVDTCTA